ncbi:MAG: hypothetical protein GF383_01300 [Candidatus Lokiarchaeota archaeon]|nr:hypothetical protein [Candidatus Lokiarchaeota archaeon]MBD3337902.1 hypothetical protein [Candidatus Lokiarchaeota archaeon]
MKTSEKIFFLLVVVGTLCHIIFLPFYPDSITLIMNWISIPFYSVLGYLGLKFFEQKAGFPDMLEESITRKERLVFPIILGIIFGIGAIIFDVLNPFKVPRLPFPISIPYWIFVAIFDEFFWRLFLLTFLIWLFSYKILKGEKHNLVFWIIIFAEAGLYMLLQISMFLQFVGSLTPILIFQIIIVSGGFVIVACYCYKKGGFLAVLTLRLTQYLLYHIIYGA